MTTVEKTPIQKEVKEVERKAKVKEEKPTFKERVKEIFDDIKEKVKIFQTKNPLEKVEASIPGITEEMQKEIGKEKTEEKLEEIKEGAEELAKGTKEEITKIKELPEKEAVKEAVEWTEKELFEKEVIRGRARTLFFGKESSEIIEKISPSVDYASAAEIYALLDQKEKAKDTVKKALEDDRWKEAAKISLILGNPQEAKKIVDKFWSGKFYVPEINELIADVVIALGDKKGAREIRDEFIEHGEWATPAGGKLAEFLVKEDPEPARELAQKMLEEPEYSPQSEPVMAAKLFLSLGEKDKAKEAVNKMIDDYKLRGSSAEIIQALGDKELAKRALEAFETHAEKLPFKEEAVKLSLFLEQKDKAKTFIEQLTERGDLVTAAQSAKEVGDVDLVRRLIKEAEDKEEHPYQKLRIGVLSAEMHKEIISKEKEKFFEEPSIDEKKSLLEKAIAKKDNEFIKQLGGTLSIEERSQFLSEDIPDSARALLDLGKAEYKGLYEGKGQEEFLKNNQELLRKYLNEKERPSDQVVKTIAETMRLTGTKEAADILIEEAQNLSPENPHLARLLRSLAEIDKNQGDQLILNFMKHSSMPDKIFSYFSRRLIEDKFLTENLKGFLKEEDMPFIRRLLAQYPNQFNTTLDSIKTIQQRIDPSLEMTPESQKEVFSALKDLGVVTPLLFDRYRKASLEERKQLTEKIKELKPAFFKNKPVKEILGEKDREILSEMIYAAYRPIGMSQEDVEKFVYQLHDRSFDLSPYNFPEDGYELGFSTETYIVKEGEHINLDEFKEWRNLFSPKEFRTEDEREQYTDHLSRLFNRLGKSSTDFKPEEIKDLLSVMSGKEFVENFVNDYQTITAENSYAFLRHLKEVTNIYFKDNYTDSLNKFLNENPDVKQRLSRLLSDPERVKTLRRKMGQKIEEGAIEEKEIAPLLSEFLSNTVLKKMRQGINKDLKKFSKSAEGEKAALTGFKAYVSKNIGSFFAKASAGICTAKDIELFNRPDHFHINIVEGDERVRGNIQGYILKEEEEKSLVLRGFNPNIDFLEDVSAESFSETILDIARKFKNENDLEHIYITPQGAWHALSNREPIANYLIKKYIKPEKQKDTSLEVTSAKTIDSIYQIE